MPKEPFVRITPLGGLGEIGLNCQLWETALGIVMIDCGLMFPADEHVGVDVIIPDFQVVQGVRDRLRGIILTHGHEDHIGALPWIVPKVRGVRIYGSPFTLALVRHKLQDHNLLDCAELTSLMPYDTCELAGLTFHCIPVCHSIPQGYALCIESPVGRIVHSGDFKIEARPLSGTGTDMAALSDFAKAGVRLLLSDSTNVTREGHSLSEREVKESLRRIFSEACGRIIITLFSSHIQRIQEVFDLALEYGRSVVVSGRSLATNLELARELGLVKFPPNYYNAHNGVPDLPDTELVLIVTGAQGEPLSALSRMAFGGHKQLSVRCGDTVLMSSRMIPGNTRAIIRLINALYHLGAEVIYESAHAIHASGHAHKEELITLLRTIRPKLFVPIHGEYRHLVKHAELACQNGLDRKNVIILEDGCPLTLFPDEHSVSFEGFHLEERIPFEYTLVDGKGVGDVEETVLRERRILGDEGLVIVVIIYDQETGSILEGPEIISRGFVFEQEYNYVLEDAKCIVLEEVELLGGAQSAQLAENIRSAVRRFFRRVLDRDPIVVPLLRSV
ncbi:MAG: ribonuclease J [Desulfovibrionaceae bacterium]|nr:ribonuclease J [Desulfovibrionaceae bacterium]